MHPLNWLFTMETHKNNKLKPALQADINEAQYMFSDTP